MFLQACAKQWQNLGMNEKKRSKILIKNVESYSVATYVEKKIRKRCCESEGKRVYENENRACV